MANCIDCNEPAKRKSNYCAACEQKKFRRIGGWLWVPLLWLLLMLVEYTLQAANYTMLTVYHPHPSLIEDMLLKSLVIGCVALWSLLAYTLFLFTRKKFDLPRIYILAMLGSLIFTLLKFGINTLFFKGGPGHEAVIAVALQVINMAIWTPYFLQSKRVNRTFVCP